MGAHADLKPYLSAKEGRKMVVELTHHYLPTTKNLPDFPDSNGKPGTYSYRVFEELSIRYDNGEKNRYGGVKTDHYRFDAVLFVMPGRNSLNQKQCFSVGIEIKGYESDLKQDDKIDKYLGWTDFFFIAVPTDLLDAAKEKAAHDDRIGVFDITIGEIHVMPVHQDVPFQYRYDIMEQVFYNTTFSEIATVIAEDIDSEPIVFAVQKEKLYRVESVDIPSSQPQEQTLARGEKGAEMVGDERLEPEKANQRAERKKARKDVVQEVMATLSPSVQATLKDVDPASRYIYAELLKGDSNGEDLATATDMSAAAVRNSIAKLTKVGLVEREGSRKTGIYVAQKPAFEYSKKCECCGLYQKFSTECDNCSECQK